MRLTSKLWVSAYIRRVNAGGGFAAIARAGADQAGAIFITVENAAGEIVLYAPAPQTDWSDDPADRRFRQRGEAPLTGLDVREILEREARFDPDFWLVGVDDRDGRHFLDDDFVGD